MINLIIGAAGSGKSRTVCEMIKNEIDSGERDVVLIVPEQQTVSWETRMSALLPPSANLRLETTNFTRLSNSVFREYGGLADTVTDEGTRALIVWRAMLSMRDRLVAFRPADNGHEDRAIPFLMDAVDELKQSGITPAAAEAALDELIKLNENGKEDGKDPHSSLVSRLSDAVHVYAAYNAILHEEFIDRGDLLDNLAAALREHRYFEGKTVFIDSFFSFTAPEERLLDIIMRQADDVSITFACPADTDERAGGTHFSEISGQLKRVRSFAARGGLETRVIALNEDFRHERSKELAEVQKKLFSSDEIAETDGEKRPSEDVKIIKCADRYDEAEACASIILKLLREGYRYSDIAVVAHDIRVNEGIIDTVLRRHGIKCFMSESSDVSSSPAVKLVLSALAVAAGGWRRKDVIRLVKTGMTPCGNGDDELTRLEENIFEKYTYTWNIRGRKMYCADEWTMNPDGYREEITETGRQILATANGCKEKIIPPLDRLLSVFGDGRGLATVREICEKIVVFAEEYGVADSIGRMRDNYKKIGMDREADRAARSWDHVCEILDKMVAVLGETPINAARFARLFSLVAGKMDKGTIPTGVDEVVLGSAAGVRFDEVKCVIMIGALEDEFPASVSDAGGFFDDRDKVALETVGLEISSPDTDTALAREMFMFYRVAAAATEKLYVLAPTGGGEKLSSGAEMISKILAETGKNAISVFGAMPLREILFDKETALYLLSRRTDGKELDFLRRYAGVTESGGVKLTARDDRLDAEKKRGETIALSQSAIEKFVSCPFMYCCERKIKVRPDAKAEINLADVGTFIHRVLERFFGELSAEKIRTMAREETETIANGIITEYMDSLSAAAGKGKGEYDGRIRYLIERLSRYVVVFIENMTEELKQSKFVPAAFELPIGITADGKKTVPPVTFDTDDGCRVLLHGIADRVDVYDAPNGKRYIRIVDYKTGSKEFSLDNISRGIDVQLLIYLFSIWKFGLPDGSKVKTVPAGAVYFSTRPAVKNAASLTAAVENRNEIMKSMARSGVLLDDEDVLRAMEEALEGRFIPVRDNGGKIESADKHLFLETADGFGILYGELEKTLAKIAGEMRSGRADAKPSAVKSAKNPCAYCDYSFVCKSARG